MDNKTTNNGIQNDMVVTLDFTLLVDGREIDSSKDTGPIQFLQGYGNIIPGLEENLYGMTVNQEKHLEIKAAQAYGEVDQEAVVEVDRSEFPAEIPLELGTEIEIENQEAQRYTAIIAEVTSEKVILDFNHPLAGKDLVFEIKVVDIRPATPGELTHGHAHDSHEHD